MDNHTFFKTPEGTIYGVSPRVMNDGYTPKDDTVLASSEEVQMFKERIKSIQEPSSFTSIEKIRSISPSIKLETLSSELVEQLTESGVLSRSRTVKETVLKPSTEEKAAIRKARREAALEDERLAAEAASQEHLDGKIADHIEIARQEEMGIYERQATLQKELVVEKKAALRKARREAALEAKSLAIEKTSQQHLEEKRTAHKKVVEEKAARRQQGLI